MHSAWFSNFRPALAATAIVAFATGIVYPALVWGGAHILFRDKANGSIAWHDGKPVGSYLIAQGATDSGSFHPRPSAAASGYVADMSSGSNAGPLDRAYVDTVVPARVAAYRADNGLARDRPVPASAVAASGSGLDPDITVEDALLQVPRVARVRKLDKSALEALVWNTARDKGWNADSLRPVNVLTLNLAIATGTGASHPAQLRALGLVLDSPHQRTGAPRRSRTRSTSLFGRAGSLPVAMSRSNLSLEEGHVH